MFSNIPSTTVYPSTIVQRHKKSVREKLNLIVLIIDRTFSLFSSVVCERSIRFNAVFLLHSRRGEGGWRCFFFFPSASHATILDAAIKKYTRPPRFFRLFSKLFKCHLRAATVPRFSAFPELLTRSS